MLLPLLVSLLISTCLIYLIYIVIGFTLQIFNVSYTVRLAFERATIYNTVLVLSMSLYAASFLPLFCKLIIDMFSLTIIVTSLLSYSVSVMNPRIASMILTLNRAHNTCYAFSTLIYMILIQLRFQIIKSVWPYRSIYVSHIFITFDLNMIGYPFKSCDCPFLVLYYVSLWSCHVWKHFCFQIFSHVCIMDIIRFSG